MIGAAIARIESREAKLEMAFLKLTGKALPDDTVLRSRHEARAGRVAMNDLDTILFAAPCLCVQCFRTRIIERKDTASRRKRIG